MGSTLELAYIPWAAGFWLLVLLPPGLGGRHRSPTLGAGWGSNATSFCVGQHGPEVCQPAVSRCSAGCLTCCVAACPSCRGSRAGRVVVIAEPHRPTWTDLDAEIDHHLVSQAPADWAVGDGLVCARSLGPPDLCPSGKFLSPIPTRLKSADKAVCATGNAAAVRARFPSRRPKASGIGLATRTRSAPLGTRRRIKGSTHRVVLWPLPFRSFSLGSLPPAPGNHGPKENRWLTPCASERCSSGRSARTGAIIAPADIGLRASPRIISLPRSGSGNSLEARYERAFFGSSRHQSLTNLTL